MTHKELSVLVYEALADGLVSFETGPDGRAVCRIGYYTISADGIDQTGGAMSTAMSIASALLRMKESEPYRAGYCIAHIREGIDPERWA